MLELEEALKRMVGSIAPLPSELVRLSESHGRFAARAGTAPVDLPLFDNSAMDGFALRAQDVRQATRENPVRLRVVGEVPAGSAAKARIESGSCVRLFTGSALPEGVDAVIMQEDTATDPNDANAIFCLDAVKPWENIRLRGEDLKKGAEVISHGQRINSGTVALLAALGVAAIEVSQKPRVGLLATGSELLEPGQGIEAGKIYESNRVMLIEPLRRAGAVPQSYMIVPDDLAQTCRALEQAFSECNAVITSGGVSVGEYDLVKKAFETLGGRLEFWRVAIKPGKPFVFGQWKEKLLFGLPGNPVSAFVTFLLLVRPALLHWQGANDLRLLTHRGQLMEPLHNPGDRRHFMRVCVNQSSEVYPAGMQASHALSSLANANGLVDVPPKSSVPTGAVVSVLRWEI
jgi:molybdopterin molybdotransferase